MEPSAEYRYDAVYRLIEATGREHLGQTGGTPTPGSFDDVPRVGHLLSASDGNAMGRYRERYLYDPAGNVVELVHRGSDPASPGWTRQYSYAEPSQLESGRTKQPLEQHDRRHHDADLQQQRRRIRRPREPAADAPPVADHVGPP